MIELRFSILTFLLVVNVTIAQTVILTSTNLPIVIIDTEEQSIPGSPKIKAHLSIINYGPGRRNYITDTPNDYDGYIGIELRGSSSQMFPKKQYAVETRTEAGDNLNVSLLGLPPENDWILYAPYSDKSLIRNILAYQLWSDMGHYSSRTRLCELVLNGEYRGVYVLMEKIKRDINRVNIAKLNPDEISDDDLTGGYIIKVDKEDGERVDGWYSPVPPFPGAWQSILYQYHYPKPGDIVPEQEQYIQGYIDQFETLMEDDNYSDPTSGYPAFINVPSFVDYVIANELAKNVDAYRLSAFMYKDKDSRGGRLTMGPIWDFNLGFGNADYYDGAPSNGWILEHLTTDYDARNDWFQMPFWWPRLFTDSTFRNQVVDRWQELRQGVLRTSRIIVLVDSLAHLLLEAQARNFLQWDILGKDIWPNAFVAGSYSAELDTLRNWLVARLEWMDLELGGAVAGLAAAGNPAGPHSYLQLRNYPNPFNPATTIQFVLPVATDLRLAVYDLLGREVALLVNERLGSGFHRVVWTGRNAEDNELPSGIYFARVMMPEYSRSIKLVLLQ